MKNLTTVFPAGYTVGDDNRLLRERMANEQLRHPHPAEFASLCIGERFPGGPDSNRAVAQHVEAWFTTARRVKLY